MHRLKSSSGIMLGLLTFIMSLFACQQAPKSSPSTEKADTLAKSGTIPASMGIADTSLRALSHIILIDFIPQQIPGYKAIGYPDINDKYDGKATGETSSLYTSPKYISFAKQQFEKGNTRAEITLMDYRPGLAEYQGYRQLYLENLITSGTQIKKPFTHGLSSVDGAFNLFPKEEKGELHLFICNRFMIDLRVVGNRDPEAELRKMAQAFPVDRLIKNYCQKQ